MAKEMKKDEKDLSEELGLEVLSEEKPEHIVGVLDEGKKTKKDIIEKGEELAKERIIQPTLVAKEKVEETIRSNPVAKATSRLGEYLKKREENSYQRTLNRLEQLRDRKQRQLAKQEIRKLEAELSGEAQLTKDLQGAYKGVGNFISSSNPSRGNLTQGYRAPRFKNYLGKGTGTNFQSPLDRMANNGFFNRLKTKTSGNPLDRLRKLPFQKKR